MGFGQESMRVRQLADLKRAQEQLAHLRENAEHCRVSYQEWVRAWGRTQGILGLPVGQVDGQAANVLTWMDLVLKGLDAEIRRLEQAPSGDSAPVRVVRITVEQAEGRTGHLVRGDFGEGSYPLTGSIVKQADAALQRIASHPEAPGPGQGYWKTDLTFRFNRPLLPARLGRPGPGDPLKVTVGVTRDGPFTVLGAVHSQVPQGEVKAALIRALERGRRASAPSLVR